MRLLPYLGPERIRAQVTPGDAGAPLRSRAAVRALVAAQPSLVSEGCTYVVDPDGHLRLAPRRSEHVGCAGGGPVRAAGELFLGRDLAVAQVTNLSTGYMPDADCFPAVAAALAGAGLVAPPGFDPAFAFRACTGCGLRQVVKDAWFFCVACDAALPARWNLDALPSGP
jgi:hypothetical protein